MIQSKKIILTVDVEDWFQVENLRPWSSPSEWNGFPLRVEHSTRRLLDLFDQFSPKQIRATFFVLGWVAKRLPVLIQEIHDRGHEVASHGYRHLLCNQLSHDELKMDLIRSKDLLEDALGCKVNGYRAPSFSINNHAMELIKSVGYRYDSSYNNFNAHSRYGQISINGYKKRGIAFELAEDFYELPISNLQVAGQILPWGGGGYFRLYPYPIFERGVRQFFKTNDAYMFYIHPWEIDNGQPRVKDSKGLSGWRHYINLGKTYCRLNQLIERFKNYDFVSCNQYLNSFPSKQQCSRRDIKEKQRGNHS